MAEKRAFEAHADVTRVQVTGDNGREIVLEPGSPYETSDAEEIRNLEAHNKVKPAERKGKS